MAWTAANGSKAAPAHMMQISGAIALVPANSVDAGTLVRDVDDNVIYLASNDWNASNNPVSLFAVSNYTRVKASTDGAALTITATDGIGFVTATGNAHTVTLPAAAQSKGRTIRVVAPTATAQNITIDGNAAETINGAATFVMLVNYQIAELTCDGTQWYANVGDPTP